MQHQPTGADVDGDRVRSVACRSLSTGADVVLHAPYILDATEFGDLLDLASVEHVIGAESRDETGEPHALHGPASRSTSRRSPGASRSTTWPGEDHTIERPADYDFWRDLCGRFLARPAIELDGLASGDAREALSSDLRRSDGAAARGRSLALPADPVQRSLPARGRSRRHHAGQLAADRLLARAGRRRGRGRAASATCAGPGSSRYRCCTGCRPRRPGPTAATGTRNCGCDRTSSAPRTAWPSTSTSARRAGSGPSSPFSSSTSASKHGIRASARSHFRTASASGSYRIDLHPSTRPAELRRCQQLPVPDPARGADPAADGEPVAGRQEHRHDAHHEWLLPASPGGMEHRRGSRRACRLLPGLGSPAAAGSERQDLPRRLPEPPDRPVRDRSLLGGGDQTDCEVIVRPRGGRSAGCRSGRSTREPAASG